MKTVLLAGGLGTRLAEETRTRPKPMVEIGGRPILWHVMKHYLRHGHDDFYVALGYLGDVVKEYFLDRYMLSGNLTVDFKSGRIVREKEDHEPWSVNLIETGGETLTGGRLLRMRKWLHDETFLLTYGDGVSDVDLGALVAFHKRHGKLATVTAVRPPARFGGLMIDDGIVTRFMEKPIAGEGWINGGFLVLEPEIFPYLHGDKCSLEADVLERLAAEGQLAAYRHDGFWQCMDTLRDKNYLEGLWSSGDAPWRTWDAGQPATLPTTAATERRKSA